MFHSAGCPGGDAFGSKRYTPLLRLADPRHMRPSKVRSPRRINAFFRLKTTWVFSPKSQICPTEKRGLSRSVERFARIGSIDWEILMEADPDDGIRSPDAVMVPSPFAGGTKSPKWDLGFANKFEFVASGHWEG